eukprot:CAMPEP_0174371124 /NCGR_PEP_ID=MMETSP0811_2-20130205/98658_1 /TAXON_ID=73025 ORGANISM="Eutreptiella gymnastica-like, Strain CCMP1594" /NCGR_SAMPLE_ID=MMETSP0811_2 /ASSEMBLY_ACC=CAM_ASM_000667 /LENGTH=32 /DNA_ID= /DNA_START= /DNA_END= /DNA_ORIENTATION=
MCILMDTKPRSTLRERNVGLSHTACHMHRVPE